MRDASRAAAVDWRQSSTMLALVSSACPVIHRASSDARKAMAGTLSPEVATPGMVCMALTVSNTSRRTVASDAAVLISPGSQSSR